LAFIVLFYSSNWTSAFQLVNAGVLSNTWSFGNNLIEHPHVRQAAPLLRMVEPFH